MRRRSRTPQFAPRPSRVKFLLSLLIVTGIILVFLSRSGIYPKALVTRRSRIVTRSLSEEQDISGYSAAERLIIGGVTNGACDGWQAPSGNDNHEGTGCWKDKWYIQLTGVLDNWEVYSNIS